MFMGDDSPRFGHDPAFMPPLPSVVYIFQLHQICRNKADSVVSKEIRRE